MIDTLGSPVGRTCQLLTYLAVHRAATGQSYEFLDIHGRPRAPLRVGCPKTPSGQVNTDS